MSALSIFGAIAVAVVTAIAVMVADLMFNDEPVLLEAGDSEDILPGGSPRKKLNLGRVNPWKGILIGLAVGLIDLLALHVPVWIVGMMYVGMAGLMVFLMIWWGRECSRLVEIVPFLVLTGLFFFVFKVTSEAYLGAFSAPLAEPWASLVRVIPWMMLIFAVGFYFARLLFFWWAEAAEKKTWHEVLAVVIMAATCFAVYAVLVNGMKSATEEVPPPAKEEPVVTKTAAPAEPAAPNWAYRHDAVLLDNFDETGAELTGSELAAAKLNDYDFGLNPMRELLDERVRNGEITYQDILKCDTEKELLDLLTVDDVFNKLVEELNDGDPAKLSGMMFWHNVKMPSMFGGQYFTEYEGKKDEALLVINNQVKAWDANRASYDVAKERFIAALKNANDIKLEYRASGINDQMYQYAIMAGDIPETIIMESPNQSGYFITFTYIVKGVTITVSYRIDCDFQPCNVSKDLNCTVKKNPNKPSSGGTPPAKPSSGGTPTTQPSGGGTPVKDTGSGGGVTSRGGTGGGTYVITNPKDVTKGTVVPEDDDPGPGPDTNNGYGARHSSADLPDNSDHGTEQDYRDDMAELHEVNDTTRDVGEPNTPTYTPPAAQDATVHSNADTGTNGNGNADTPSTEHSTRVESNLGETSGGAITNTGSNTTSDDPAGVEWGGPPN